MNLYRLMILFALFVSAPFGKEAGGILTVDTRWNAEEGPYYITCDLLVPENVRLTITAGTRVIIGSPALKDTLLTQYDDIDSRTVAIKIQGSLICIGKSGQRITFAPDSIAANRPSWYGIVLHRAEEQFTEIAHSDITGAYCGIVFRQCSPAVRNSIIEHNHIGLRCTDGSSPHIYNCVVVFNSAAGIRVEAANPQFSNNIIAFNRNNGLWCDGTSKITFEYNCIAFNGDGDFLECDPYFGLLVKKNKHGDSIDIFNNLRCDPVFSGSTSESAARQKDISLPTEKHLVRDTALIAVLHDKRKQATGEVAAPPGGRYRLSKYSPCIDAGNPAAAFKDADGSRNDMGIWGGPEISKKK